MSRRSLRDCAGHAHIWVSVSPKGITLFGIGGFELFLILLFGFLIFGPDKLPAIAKTVGQGIAKFRSAQEEMNKVLKNEVYDPNSDTPFQNPLDVVDKAVTSAKDGVKKVSGSSASTSKTAAGASKPQAKTAEKSPTKAEEKRQETFSERKARYDAERAAKKAAEAAEAEAKAAEEKEAAKAAKAAAAPAAAKTVADRKPVAAKEASKTDSATATSDEPAGQKPADAKSAGSDKPSAASLYGTAQTAKTKTGASDAPGAAEEKGAH